MPDLRLERIAEEVLKRLPASVPQSVTDSLRQPTRKALLEAGAALLATGQIDLAESLYHMLTELSDVDLWPVFGLARVASRRGEPSAIVAAWTECLRRFPDRAEPSWYLEIVRAERRRENYLAAEEHSRLGAERFPDSAPLCAARAEALLALGRNEESIAAFHAALRKFPDQAKPHWFMGLALALRAAGHFDEEEKLIEDISARFPNEPAALAFRAQHAGRKQDWSQAHTLWTECLREEPQQAMPHWLNGCAHALFRLWRPEEALDMWNGLRRRFPDFVPAFADAAAAFEELGHWDVAQQLWTELIERNPANAKLEWHVHRARCVLKQPYKETLEPAIKELESRFSNSSMGRRLAFEALTARNEGFGAVSTLIEDAVTRFPDDRDLMLLQVQILLGAGRPSEAEGVVHRLEATVDDHLALTGRWLLVTDRGDVRATRERVERAVTDRSWMLVPGIVIDKLLMDISLPWTRHHALALCEDMATQFPGRITTVALKARVLLELYRDVEALELIDAVPLLYRGQDILELRAWAAARRGDHDGAREIWKDILSNCYFPAVHSPEPVLELMTPGRDVCERDGVVAFVPVRDEMANLPDFLKHHRRLGVRQFVMIDNRSTDGTDSYLLAQPDVILYRTEDSFPAAGSGMRWINFLIDRHGGGGWCLFADADEDFVYPGWETTPLDKLVEYLDRQDAEGMSAFMLDVYPEQLIASSGRAATRANCGYFDSNYVWGGIRRPPYRRPLGGIRARLFGNIEIMSHKIPLVRSGRGVYLNNHETTPLRFADVSGALLHYKMVDLFSKAGQYFSSKPEMKVTDRILSSTRRYERYAARLKSIANIDLCVDGVTQPLPDSLVLADRGLMQAPPHYRRWLNAP